MNELDKKYLFQTIKLAKKAEGKTSPNPMVGVLIIKNGRIVGSGFHKKRGGPHAEINALRKAGSFAKGAVLYVNLEPCSHYGRTPPCVKAIIQAGIKRVVVGMKDPNYLNNGKGLRELVRAGIEVEVAKEKKDFEQLNKFFVKYITKKIPFIAVKAGQSLDGRIAACSGQSQWITNESSRIYAHKLRKKYDAIMVGIGTILKDNPNLSYRAKGKARIDAPVKVIVDSTLKISRNANIFSSKSPAPVIIATTEKAIKAKGSFLNDIDADIIACPVDKNSHVDLHFLMAKLAEYEITSVLVEGGGKLNGALFDEQLVDKVYFFIAPKIMGGEKALSSVEGRGITSLEKAVCLKNMSLTRLKGDILIEADVKYSDKN